LTGRKSQQSEEKREKVGGVIFAPTCRGWLKREVNRLAEVETQFLNVRKREGTERRAHFKGGKGRSGNNSRRVTQNRLWLDREARGR